MNDKDKRSPVHWSKDFVEHLRTVHFALIAVSAGIILLVFSSKQFNPITALTQIEEIMELKKQWSANWIDQHVHQKGLIYNRPRFVKQSDLSANRLEVGPSATGVSVDIAFDGATKTMTFSFPKGNCFEKLMQKKIWLPCDFPRTLTDFKDWWSSLSSREVIIPSGLAVEGTAVSSSSSGLLQGASGKIVLRETIQSDSPSRALRLRETSDQTFVYEYRSGSDLLSIPITDVFRYQLDQSNLQDQFRGMPPGTFKSTFLDLDAASIKITDLEFDDVKELLHDDAAKGPEVFEAFGMKFPAGQVTLWGVVLLLSVQLYFVTYLKQLRGKLGSDDAGWDVPWIGMNPSRDAQSIFLFTISVLPFGAIAILTVHQMMSLAALTYQQLTESSFAELVSAIRILVGRHSVQLPSLLGSAAVGIWLAILSWKYRPVMIGSKEEDNPETTSMPAAPPENV